ncbi:NUDIX hydrolase [Microlunatus parietis]|uniref:8-oxo-dGTP pyrophosphatase MutT (NUDIX family) n=1 Tax=Microlunatus parietis TaxID=682979 RepID=A0A7Y9LE36_9ACTN|nr:NUDIX domain-containing protein [Microlunatus parietis]NYE73470.1 8-oxo-dGTP pyrophosphatase MutT (NUDIX family) [Microlunatus parietis]
MGDNGDEPRFEAVDPQRRPQKQRQAVRVIMIDDHDRVLLFQDTDPGCPGVSWWVTPGGGIDPGETETDAAVRELAEETGYRSRAADLIGPLAVRRAVHGYSDQILVQDETFYAIKVRPFEIDISGHTEDEQLTIAGHRWWPAADLTEPDGWLWPAELAELVALANSPNGAPRDLGVQEESTVPIGS